MTSPYYDYQYHYWFHLGEAHAIRQVLGYTDLPQFIGGVSEASYLSRSQQA